MPYKFLYELMTRMSIYYSNNVEKSFIFNAKGISTLWMMGKKMIPEHTRKKIHFIDDTNQQEILKFIDELELEQRYGGKLNNLTEFWPPKPTNEEFDCVIMQQDDAETDFYSLMNDEGLFLEKEETICSSNDCKCAIF